MNTAVSKNKGQHVDGTPYTALLAVADNRTGSDDFRYPRNAVAVGSQVRSAQFDLKFEGVVDVAAYRHPPDQRRQGNRTVKHARDRQGIDRPHGLRWLLCGIATSLPCPAVEHVVAAGEDVAALSITRDRVGADMYPAITGNRHRHCLGTWAQRRGTDASSPIGEEIAARAVTVSRHGVFCRRGGSTGQNLFQFLGNHRLDVQHLS